MHEHWSVPRWIRALGDPEGRQELIEGCPEARELWAEDQGAWMAHTAECPRCRRVAAAQDIVPDEVLTCPECRSALEVVHSMVDELEHFDPLVALELPRAEEMLEQVEALPLREQIVGVLADLPLRQWGFCQRLLFEARRTWHDDPHRAHERAVLAVAVAERLDPEDYHAQWIADLQAKALAFLANTHRVLGAFGRADRELRRAEERLPRGIGSGRAEARVLSFRASLLIDQSRHREALAVLARVEELYGNLRERHEVGRTCMKRALALEALDRPGEAAEECARAAAELDPEREPVLPVLARQNAVHFLVQAGQVERSRSLFDALPPVQDRVIGIYRSWIEADLLRAEGRNREALQVYEEARQAFAGLGLHYDAALVTLDRALVTWSEGRPEEVHQMAEEASVLLTRAGAKHEAFAALHLLLRAIERETLTFATLQRVRRHLGRLKPS